VLRSDQTLRTLLTALGLTVTMGSTARAEPLPHTSAARVGLPARSVPIRVEAAEGGAEVTVGRGGAAERRTLLVPGAASAVVEPVGLRGGASVAIVRVEGADGARAAALIAGRARPAIVWSGRLDPTGDPGERRRDVIEIGDRDGDGSPDVVVGIVFETTHVCGQRDTLLFPRAVDPRTLALREITLRRLAEGVDQVEVTATAESPGPPGEPLLQALQFRTASSSAGSPEDPALVEAPVALSDASAETVWREGRAGPGRWEFATAAFTGGELRIRALTLTLPPAGAGAPPRHLWLVGDRGPRVRVTIPEPIATTPGARAWIVPPAPLDWQCLSVVLDDAWGASGPTAIAQVAAYTSLDFGEGLPTLIEELVADGERGPESARLLATLGEPAVAAVREAWETLTPTGRRRSLRVFGENAATSEAARAGLVTAARDPDDDVRGDALRALAEAGEVAVGSLAALVPDARAGDDAAIALARRHPDEATPILLEAMAEGSGSERRALRRALQTAAERGTEEARETIARWVAGGPETAAAAAAALSLSRAEPARESAAALLRGVAGEARRFEDRWRLVAASKALDSDPPVDAWLATTARDAEEWMLRAAALEALAARDEAASHVAARAAIDDPYPRVRVAAIEVLARDAQTVDRIAVAARRDGWPMVRAAAVGALADDPRALPVVRAAVDDRSGAVRAAAIRALVTARDRGAADRIAARLEDPDELPDVLRAGIEYARGLCLRELAEPVAAVLRRGMRPSAWALDVEVAVEAVHALALIGGEEADDALDRAASDLAPPAIRAAAHQARRTVQSCR